MCVYIYMYIVNIYLLSGGGYIPYRRTEDACCFCERLVTLWLNNMAGKGTLNEDVFRIEHEDICIGVIAILVYQKGTKGTRQLVGSKLNTGLHVLHDHFACELSPRMSVKHRVCI